MGDEENNNESIENSTSNLSIEDVTDNHTIENVTDNLGIWALLFAAAIAVFIMSFPFINDLYSIILRLLSKVEAPHIFTLLVVLFFCSSVNWTSIGKNQNQIVDKLKSLPYPTLFLSIGIFGTFLGIYQGLSDLDLGPNNTSAISRAELNGLIGGLITSFTTSLFGILFALLYRTLIIVFGSRQESEAGIPDVVSEISHLGTKLDVFIDDLKNKVVSGLSEALQDLVTNLEKVVSDQLGNAFKELNESIVALNEWVIEYRDQVNTLTQAYKNNLIGIEEFNQKAENIVSSLEPLPEYMGTIEEVLEKINIPLTEFSALGTRAQDAFPIIKRNVEEITDGFSSATDALGEAQQSTANLAQALSEEIKNLPKKIESLDETTRQLMEKHEKFVETLFLEFEKNLASISEKFAKDYSPITERLKEVLASVDTRRDTDAQI